MEDYRKRVQIPAFGNWDYCDEMPITQYFDSAMLQSGLVRGSHYYFAAAAAADADHDHHFKVPSTPPPHKTPHHRHTKSRKAAGGGEKRMAREQQMRKQQGKVYDLTSNQSPNMFTSTTTATSTPTTTTSKPKAPKAVDEDLYKIPPELLYQKPKKKRLLRNLWSGCLGLNCIA